MSVMIEYRNPRRPDEAGISYVPDDGYAAALKDRLVKRGFQIIEIVPTPAAAVAITNTHDCSEKVTQPRKRQPGLGSPADLAVEDMFERQPSL
jgi:hypothetical protein